MTGPSPGLYGDGSSSSSAQVPYDRGDLEDLDEDGEADLSLDNALLTDDPLSEGGGKAPSVS